MKINQVLVESAGATVAFAFGRFNPAHQGHIEVWRAVEQAGANWFIGTNPSTLGPNDPLTFQQKSAWMEEIYPPIQGHIVPEQSVLTLAAYIFKKLRKNERATVAYITDATDWAWSGKLLNQYNGVEGAHGYYKFAQIIHEPSPRVSSATALRDAARANDRVAFYHASGTDPKSKVAGLTYFDTVKQACEKYPVPVKRGQKVKEGWKTGAAIGGTLGALAGATLGGYSPIDTQAGAAAGAAYGGFLGHKYNDWKNQRNKEKSQRTLDDKLKKHSWDSYVGDWYNYIYELKKEAFAISGGWSDSHRPGYEFVPADEEDDTILYMNTKLWNMLSKIEEHFQEEIIKIAISKKTEEQKIKEFQNIGELAVAEFQKYQKVGESVSEDEQKTQAKTWDQMTPQEKISGVKGRTVWNEKTRKYYTVFDVPAKEVDEASLATMRDYFAGDENARDPMDITKQRLYFAKDANAKANMQKRFRSQAEYELWLKQNKLRQISGVKEDEEAGEVKQQGQLIPFPAGTTKVHVSDVYDWYKLGQVISDLDDANPATFGQGAPQTVIAFSSEEEESKLLPLLSRLGLRVDDIDPEGTDEVGEAYHAGSLYEMLKKERTKNWALINKRK